jgi:uncharacterized protein YoxC
MALTPEQFNKLATKDEFNELKDEVLEIKGDVKKVLTAVDGLAKSVKDIHIEMASNQGAHDRPSDKINSHEVRIKKLEYKNA